MVQCQLHKRNQKVFRNKILNSKEVKHALKYANESFEMNQLVGMLHEHVLNLTEKSLIDLQKIVDTKGAAKVGGVMVDMFTASMITQIYDKVNDKNKQKMDKSKIEVLVNLAQKMMQKMEYDPSDIVEGRALKPKQIAKKYKREIEHLQRKDKVLKWVDTKFTWHYTILHGKTEISILMTPTKQTKLSMII